MSSNILEVGSVQLNIGEQELSAANSIRLSSKESKMMAYLMRNLGKSLSQSAIFAYVWLKEEANGLDDSYVLLSLSYLRQKLQAINADIRIEERDQAHFALIREEGDPHV